MPNFASAGHLLDHLRSQRHIIAQQLADLDAGIRAIEAAIDIDPTSFLPPQTPPAPASAPNGRPVASAPRSHRRAASKPAKAARKTKLQVAHYSVVAGTKATAAEMTPNRGKVWDAIKHGRHQTRDIVEATGLKAGAVTESARWLQDRGFVAAVEAPRS